MLYLTTPSGLISCSNNSLAGNAFLSSISHDLLFCLPAEAGADCILTDKTGLMNRHRHSPLLVFDPATLECIATSDEEMASVTEYLSFHQNTMFRNNILSLIFYFSFNPVPSSVTLIQRWLTDAGIESEEVKNLADMVFEQRTGLSETTIDRVEDYRKMMHNQSSLDPYRDRCPVPFSLPETFSLISAKPWLMPLYDRFSKPDSSGEVMYFLADQIEETSMLIEDHAFIVAGLSISVTRLARMTESGYPLFFKNILETIPLAERDIFSLGRLLMEHPDLFLVLTDRYHVRLHLISVNREHTYYASEFISGSGFSACLIPDALPVLLRLTK